METWFSPRSRAERLIAAGRVVLAATSLLALWRDPSEPAKYAATAYALLAAYLAVALVLLAAGRRATGSSRAYGVVTHSFDLAFFSAFMYFTSGPASPFIAYFVFALVCATLRWQWRGTLWTAIVSLGVYSALGFYFATVLDDPNFEPNKFFIRGVYMAVVAFLLGYLGHHEQRTREEMAMLAAWRERAEGSREEVVRRVLEQMARVHRARTVALAWGEIESLESREQLEAWSGGELRSTAVESGDRPLVAVELAESSFLATSDGRRAEVLLHAGSELRRWRGEPVGDVIRDLERDAAILSAPWRGELAAGRIFVFDRHGATTDDLLLAEIVATLAGAQIDGHLALERRRHRAAVDERIRVARDLHDGVLQSLTGIGLRVAAARRQLAEDASSAARGLDELQRLVAVEQRDLRFLIQDLEPPPDGQPEFDLTARLAELVHRVEREWQLDVAFEADGLDDELAEAAERDLYFIVREALVNAVRHGEARRVAVRLTRVAPGRVELEIEDDGRGFAFRGRFDQDQLAALRQGPRSLRERVAARGGTLVLDSSDRGARLEIGVPV